MSMTHDEMIAVIAAHKQGNQIEISQLDYHGSPVAWSVCHEPKWNFSGFRYRVKPEPVECWAVVENNGGVLYASIYKSLAVNECNGRGNCRIVRMIEAPEGDK